LLGRHRVPHGLGCGHAGGQLLEQFVEGGRVAREQVAELLHERLEAGVDGLARLALLDHPVQRVERLPQMLQLCRVGVGQRVGHLLEVGPGDLLAQTLDQLLEMLARLGRHELVLLQAAHRAGQVAREQVELHAPLGSHLVGDLPSALVPRGLGIGLQPFDAGTLLAQHLLELLGHLAVGATQVTPLELLLTFEPELVQEIAQSLHLLAVGGAPPAVEHPLERFVEVAVGQEVVGQLRQHRVGVVDQRVLGSVPTAVVEAPGHPRPR
jgi:hypothetical protein